MITVLSIMSGFLALLIGEYSVKQLKNYPSKSKKKKSAVHEQIKNKKKNINNYSVSFNKLINDELPYVYFLNNNAYSPKTSIMSNFEDKNYFVLKNSHTCFGRVQTCDIVVKDFSISRIHFEIELNDGIAKIKDCQSTNGTFLNGKRIDGEAILLPGDVIQIGETSLIYQGTSKNKDSR